MRQPYIESATILSDIHDIVITAHAQYSEQNELKLCRLLSSRFPQDNDFFPLL